MANKNNEQPTYTTSIICATGVLDAATAGSLGSNTNGATIYASPNGAKDVGTRIDSLVINTNDTAIVNVFIYILDTDDTTVIPLGIVNVPASSGNSGSIASVDALSGSGVSLQGMKKDGNGKFYIDLAADQTLKCSVLAAMTAAKKCWVTAMGGNYN